MKKYREREEGIALVSALVLTLLSLILVMIVMKMVLVSTYSSGSLRSYTSSLASTKGGVEDFVMDLKGSSWIQPIGSNWLPSHFCKLQRETNTWSSVCSFCNPLTLCTSDSTPQDIINYADWKKSYGNCTVYVKIVDCTAFSDGYVYTIDVVGKYPSSPEVAWVTIVFEQKLQ